MAEKKIPERQCIGCGQKKKKKELIRVIRTPEDQIEIDFTGKKNGRGAYLCNSLECLKMARKKRAVERSLQREVSSGIYDELEKELMENE